MGKDGANRNGSFTKMVVTIASAVAVLFIGSVFGRWVDTRDEIGDVTYRGLKEDHDRYEAKHIAYDDANKHCERRIQTVEKSVAVQEVMFEQIQKNVSEIKELILRNR